MTTPDAIRPEWVAQVREALCDSGALFAAVRFGAGGDLGPCLDAIAEDVAAVCGDIAEAARRDARADRDRWRREAESWHATADLMRAELDELRDAVDGGE